MGGINTLSQLLNVLKKGKTITIDGSFYQFRSQAAHEPIKAERHFCICIAGHAIGIDTLYRHTFTQCGHYLSDLEPEFHIGTNEDDLARERLEAKQAGIPSADYQLESLAVCRKISEAMLAYNTFLMHGAVVAASNSAYMFTAESGTGKTTHIRKWLDNLEDAFIVNGDKPLIKVTDTQVISCGTPWCGKENMSTNTMVPLKAIVLMERGEINYIEEISFGKAFPFLLQQTYRPNDAENMKKTLDLLKKLNGRVRFYKFVFNNLKDDAFSVAYNALVGGKP